MIELSPFANPSVMIDYQGRQYAFDSLQRPIQIGRSQQCDVIIHARLASRIHLCLSHQDGQILIQDISTNGSWIKSANGREYFLRHEEIQLPESGLISFDGAFHEKPQHILSFQIKKQTSKPQ